VVDCYIINSISGNPSHSRQLIFGPFAFDEASGELSKHGIRVRLQGQPLQILATLIRQSGQVVSRDEFQQQLWNGSTFVDFDHGLNAAMNRLRQALGDSADQPRYIETLPGRGYRFVAAVQDTLAKPILVMTPAPIVEEVVPAAVAAPVDRTRTKIRREWMIVAGIIAGLAGGYLAAHRQQANSVAPPLRFSITPPSGYALVAASSRQAFALSPDGDRLAFTAMDSSGVFRTFIRDLDTLESRPLANSIGTYSLFWSADSRSLFLTARGKVKRSAVDSDSYQVVSDAPSIMLSGALLDARNLLLSGRSVNSLVPTSGGTGRVLKELYPWPQVLPDGKHVLYTIFDSRLGRHRARVVKFGEPETARDLLETDSRTVYAPSVLKPETGYLLSVRAGNLLAHSFDPRSLRVEAEPLAVVSRVYSFFPTGGADFSVSNNGTLAYKSYVSRSQLAWVNRQGEMVSTIGPDNVNLKQASLSPDGKKIATTIYDVDRGVNALWIIDAETGAGRRLAAGRGTVDSPVWAPDSSKLAYSRAYDSPPKLFLRALGEQDTDEPLPPAYFQAPTDWSRDGRFLAWTNTSFAQIENEMRGEVWLIDMARQRKPVRLSGTSNHESSPAFSPDGRWLAFTSDESGRTEVYVQSFEAGETPRLVGERHLVSRHGAICLRWRRDGKELFYLAWDGRLYAVPITLSPGLKIAPPAPLFTISTEARAALHSTVGFDVSADGQRLLVPVVTSAEKSEIVVIQNWEAALQRSRGKVN
jgi:eukaryotic-like serine/threonine-protein kinase